MNKKTRLDAATRKDVVDKTKTEEILPSLENTTIQPSWIIYDPDARRKYGEPDFYVEIKTP